MRDSARGLVLNDCSTTLHKAGSRGFVRRLSARARRAPGGRRMALCPVSVDRAGTCSARPVALGACRRAGRRSRRTRRAARRCRFSDVGWTDITATTAIASRLLEGLGYEPKIQVLSVPVTYTSMKNKDIDVFLGNWMPTMEADRKPYRRGQVGRRARASIWKAPNTRSRSRSISTTRGSRAFADIAKFQDKLPGKIYGIEPGNDGNRLIIDMIKADKFGLQKFQIVESSEQGMLAQVERAVEAQGADRLPRLGAAPDEHQVRDQISRGRRRCLRPQPRRRDDLHQHPRRLHAPNARTPARSSRT